MGLPNRKKRKAFFPKIFGMKFGGRIEKWGLGEKNLGFQSNYFGVFAKIGGKAGPKKPPRFGPPRKKIEIFFFSDFSTSFCRKFKKKNFPNSSELQPARVLISGGSGHGMLGALFLTPFPKFFLEKTWAPPFLPPHFAFVAFFFKFYFL